MDPSNQWVAGAANIIGSAVKPKVWYHLVLVQDGTANKRIVYVNGKVDFQGTAIDVNGGGDLWMGGAKSVNEFLHGRIDDVFLYNRPLAEKEVPEVGKGLAVEPQTKLATTWGEIKR